MLRTTTVLEGTARAAILPGLAPYGTQNLP